MRLSMELRSPRAVAPVVAALLLIVLVSSAAAVPRPDVVFFRVGDKFAAMGWTMGEDENEIDDFGGYRLWMREVWKNPDTSPESFSLVREYVLGEDDPNAAGYWPFNEYWAQPTRSDSAEIFQNAFPYEFSVSAFSASDPVAVNHGHIHANRTGVVYPRVGTRSDLAEVKCIPNPYRASADWEYGGNRRVTFVGLPERAIIRIYTAAADHVRTLDHNDSESDLEFWDLKNSDGEEIAAGVYIYQVESPGHGSIESKVMIIK